MSSDEVFLTSSTRFSQAVKLINEADDESLSKLIPKICKNLCFKDDSTLSDDERAKIQSVFDMDILDVSLFLEAIEFVFQQAAYYGMKGKVLGKNLLKVSMDESKCKLFVDVWSDFAKVVIDSMRKHSFATKQLDSVDWHLGIQLSQDNKTEQKHTTSLFHFNLLDNSSQMIEKVDLEFTHEELLEFYEKLEVLQGQLDALS